MSVNWDVQLSRNLRVLANNITDYSDFFKDALDIVQKRTNDMFTAQWKNLEKSSNWKDLSQTTLVARSSRQWYYKNAPNNPWVLRWTWRLQEDVAKIVGNTSASITWKAPYAEYHQEWWWRLPKRAIIDLSNETNNKIVKALQSKINRDIRIYEKQV